LNIYGREKIFIADFFYHDLKLVIEIDGGNHLSQKEYDKNRSEILQSQMDLKIIRFRNEEVLNYINRVLIKMKQLLEPNPVPSLAREG
jgi:very-short-patch-repair endonuclease